MTRRPHGMLFDYGGTLVDEESFDTRAGIELLLGHAERSPAATTVDALLARANRVSREVADRRDTFQIEIPWASLTRLIHNPFGIRFTNLWLTWNCASGTLVRRRVRCRESWTH